MSDVNDNTSGGWSFTGADYASLPPDMKRRVDEHRKNEPIAEVRVTLYGPDTGRGAVARFRVSPWLRAESKGDADPAQAAADTALLAYVKRELHEVETHLHEESRGDRAHVQCSFCGKNRDAVRQVVSGPGIIPPFICNECVALCAEIMAESETGSSSTPPDHADSSANGEAS